MNSLILKASLKRSLKSGEPRSVTYSHYDRVSKKVVEKKKALNDLNQEKKMTSVTGLE